MMLFGIIKKPIIKQLGLNYYYIELNIIFQTQPKIYFCYNLYSLILFCLILSEVNENK